jgi:hypothetical protein
VGLERGQLSLVTTIEELLERKSSGSGLEIREYGRRDPSRYPRGTLCPKKLALTSLTSGCRSIGIVRSRTQATEFSFLVLLRTTFFKLCLHRFISYFLVNIVGNIRFYSFVVHHNFPSYLLLSEFLGCIIFAQVLQES